MSRLRFLTIGLALAASACSNTPIAPSIPDPIFVTDTFSDTLTVNGGVTHQIVVSSSGVVTAVLTAINPDPTVVVGLQIGAWNGTGCVVPTIVNDKATLNAPLNGQSTGAGNLCVRVYDSGKLTEAVTYQVQVRHP
jgi:ABC-type Fe3+-hydroxamate transport system substrate-binding protein